MTVYRNSQQSKQTPRSQGMEAKKKIIYMIVPIMQLSH